MRDPEFDPPGPLIVDAPAPDGTVFAWLRDHERGLLAAAIAVQFLVLASMVAANTIPWRGSTTVLLRVVPVDPRDLLRGDYVILGYDISRLPAGGVLGLDRTTDFRGSEGRTVYVALRPEADGRHYHGDGVSLERPVSGRFIRGTIASSGRIVFGIESYFVQEGKGHDYEQAIRRNRLSAEVALTADGRAALRRLVDD